MAVPMYVLREGDEGQEVRRLQRLLCLATADGKFGPATKAAVTKFQQLHGLTADGVAGPRTLTCLGVEVAGGADLSHHNQVEDWNELSTFAKFLFLKASEGRGFTDKTFLTKAELAQRAGISIVGAYHFANTSSSVVDNANNFIKMYNSGRKAGLMTGLPVLDIESDPMSLAPPLLRAWAKEWLQRVEDAIKLRPLLYTYGPFLRSNLGGGEDLASWPLWIARYRGNKAVDPGPVGDWDEWLVWQFAADYGTPGIAGKSDRNWVAGGKLEMLRTD